MNFAFLIPGRFDAARDRTQIRGGVQIVGTVPANTHKNIVYPGAVTSESKNAAATQEFLDWCLSSDKAQEIWQKWGFELA